MGGCGRDPARRRQRPPRLPFQAADAQAGDLGRRPASPWSLAAVAGAALLGPLVGLAAAVGALLIALLVVFAIADSKAEDAFFETYAQQRGLTLSGKGPLPPATPLLRKGDDRYANRTLTGALADGVDGTLALYTYEEETTDSEGNTADQLLPLHARPDRGARVRGRTSPSCSASRSSACARWRSSRTSSAAPKQRVKLESEALDEKYEIFAGKEQDAGLAAPALLPHLHRLADRLGAEEVRLRAGRRHPLLLRPRPQGERRGAGRRPRRLGRGRHPVARRGAGVARSR